MWGQMVTHFARMRGGKALEECRAQLTRQTDQPKLELRQVHQVAEEKAASFSTAEHQARMMRHTLDENNAQIRRQSDHLRQEVLLEQQAARSWYWRWLFVIETTIAKKPTERADLFKSCRQSI